MSKLELNIRQLLIQCEELVNDEKERWRLTRYIKSLDTMVKELEDFETVDRKKISETLERIRELKTQINYVEPAEKLTKSKLRSTDDGIMKEIKQIKDAKHNAGLRKELFDGDDTTGLRQRGAKDSSENMEKYYENIQEKLGEEMLSLTRSLKEQTLTASKIIKKDTAVVTKSAKLAHQNTGSLEKEAKKLDEHNKRACKCWMWMMIVVVIMIFVAMVLFMKLMKKRKPS